MHDGFCIRVAAYEIVHLGSRCDVQAFEHMIGHVLLQPAEIIRRSTARQVVDTDCQNTGDLRHVTDERRPDEPRAASDDDLHEPSEAEWPARAMTASYRAMTLGTMASHV